MYVRQNELKKEQITNNKYPLGNIGEEQAKNANVKLRKNIDKSLKIWYIFA
jgi:hypothetical protein